MEQLSLQGGKYELQDALGASAFGEVWRAQDAQGQHCAIKRVRRDSANAAAASAAQQELALLQQFMPWDSAHLPQLLDHGQDQGGAVLALELAHTDLHAHMQSLKAAGRSPDFHGATLWLQQVNQALLKLHERGLSHLDVKPANVLLYRTPQGLRAKLADFGSVRAVTAAGGAEFCGTPGWQAPEQFFPDQHGRYAFSAQSDLFSLGALWFWLVCGGLPLAFGMQCQRAWKQDGWQAASRLQPGATPTLSAEEAELFAASVRAQAGAQSAQAALALLQDLLAANPAQRPGHGLQVAQALQKILQLCAPAADNAAAPPPASWHEHAMVAALILCSSWLLLALAWPAGKYLQQMLENAGVA
ncbi:protein kinase [Massilia sp. W12]|uniref:protein kinase domain-containing protein n=1 Tax=Massilia sp. W12 TaxID=3126507 RepID=UPI0030D3388B